VYKDEYKDTSYDIGIWNRGKPFDDFLPYLLTLSNKSTLMIGETRGELLFTSPSTYNGDQEKAEYVLKNAMRTTNNILQLYDRTIENKKLMDIDKTLGSRAILDQGRRWLDPNDTLSYELYRPAEYWGSYGGNAAGSSGGRIQFESYKMEDYTTLAHEFSHELQYLFNTKGEFYTTYIESVYRQSGAYVNVFADGNNIKHQSNIIANTSTENFQNKGDLVNYSKNIEDAVYALDGIIANKILSLPLEEQVKYIKIAEVNGDEGIIATEDEKNQVSDLTVEQLKDLKIKTIDDLILHHAIIMKPGDTNKNILRILGQGYGTSLTYSAFFLVNGKPYDHNHRIINTLLSFDGWEAFRNFNDDYKEALDENWAKGLRNNELIGAASLQALRKVYNRPTLTYSSLIKERYGEVLQKLKTHGFMDKSYNDFLNNMTIEDLEDLYSYKYKILSDYFVKTKEFSNPIFGSKSEICTVITKYMDTKHQSISNDLITRGLLGEEYTTKKKEISGYSYKEVQGEASGKFTVPVTTVNYIYTKNKISKGSVVIKYVDTEDKTISKEIIKYGKIGENYTTEEKNIKGYSFKKVKGSPLGKFTKNSQIVTYIYIKNKENVNSHDKDSKIKPNHHAKEKTHVYSKENILPKTGENKITTLYEFFLGVLLLFLIPLVHQIFKTHKRSY
ncbi:MucBP domain-containing protein, partial [Lactococcus garvieae]|uniref:MucBP domain-containing protein n=1 Tax=Lactococcus garvieae TaxID=1363 RepID=UPI00254EB26A